MSNFWPSGIELSDTQSPFEILETARQDWETNSDSVFTLVLQRATSEAGNAMIIVHAKHIPSERTATLLSVIHRPNAPYPATIQPKDEDLPNTFKKSYYRPGMADVSVGAVLGTQGSTVTNKWVSDTPSEFRSKLVDAFNLSTIKTEVLNLASNVAPDTPTNSEEPTEDEAPEG